MGFLVSFVVSAVLVDLIGYWLHRWSHRKSSGPLNRSHMTHHVVNYPPWDLLSKRYRSSKLDNLALWFAPFGIVYVVAGLVIGVPNMHAVIAGGLLVAVLNSVVHDAAHISGSFIWRSRRLSSAAERHLTHHKKMGKNFGILFNCWDQLFGTSAESSSRR